MSRSFRLPNTVLTSLSNIAQDVQSETLQLGNGVIVSSIKTILDGASDSCLLTENATKSYVDTSIVNQLAGMSWKEPIISMYDASAGLPTNPSNGDRYICAVAGNAWVKDAYYQWNNSWIQSLPSEGDAVFVKNVCEMYSFSSGAWTMISDYKTDELDIWQRNPDKKILGIYASGTDAMITTYTPLIRIRFPSPALFDSNLSVGGAHTITNTTDCSGVGTGALICSGGASIGLNMYVGGSLTSTGSISTSGLTSSGAVKSTSSTDSSSTSTGAMIVSGGLGVAKGVYIGSNLHVGGTATLSAASVTNGLTVGTTLNVTGASTLSSVSASSVSTGTLSSGTANVTSSTDSSSTTTGAVIVSGGAGIAKNLNVGSNLKVDGTATLVAASVTNGLTVGTTLNVTGASTLSSVSASSLNTGALSITSGQSVSSISTDGTLSGNSDSAISTQKAVKTYVDAHTAVPAGGANAIQYTADGTSFTGTSRFTYQSANNGSYQYGTVVVADPSGTNYVSITADKLNNANTISAHGVPLTIGGGLQLANSVTGYVPTSLTYYEEATIGFTTSGAFAVPGTLKIVRVGSLVSMAYAQMMGTTTADDTINAQSGTLPARFCPTTAFWSLYLGKVNNTYTTCKFVISTNGTITWYANITTLTFGLNNSSGVYAGQITYNIIS